MTSEKTITNNYQTYLRRMTESYDNTTKSLIPFYTAQAVKNLEYPRILDVGLGSGVVGKGIRAMIPNAIIDGIDMVQSNIDHAPADIYDNLIVGRFENYGDERTAYDAVIFASVLHEIGSYAENGRFTDAPVREALFHAVEMLNPGGVIVIREGLAEHGFHAKDTVVARLRSEDDWKMLNRFCTERPLSDEEQSEEQPRLRQQPQRIGSGNEYDCLVYRDVLREFLCTWTWGIKSWPREIQERFCYFPARKWEAVLRECGLKVITDIQSPEEYPDYFRKIIEGYETDSPFVGVFVGRK